MRERVTFVHPQWVEVDPKALQSTATELRGPTVETTREGRLTIALEELPAELASLLKEYKELHIRWASPLAYDSLEPFISRISPGLHVFHTSANKTTAPEPFKLCTLLQSFGSVDCTTAEAFTAQSIGQENNGAAVAFYQELEDLSQFIKWASKEICAEKDATCQSRVSELSKAASLDISWDSIPQAIRISSLLPLGEHSITVPGSSKRRTEVGILSKDRPPNLEAHEIGVSGLLTVLGERKDPSGTLFAVPSRHRQSGASFSAQFIKPAGLHPTLQLKLSTNKPPVPDEECAPHAYFTLPRTIFADRYQFADELFLASKNLTASRYTTLPVDLEAPVYTTRTWGSSVLLELAPPSSQEPEAWTAEIPLHLRYLKPSESGHVDIEIPFPAVFWACESDADADFSTNPFDRRQLGYDGLFGDKTVFWHAKPLPETGNRIMTPISVPVLKEHGATMVGYGTAGAVLLGFIWVLWKLLGVFMATGYGNNKLPGQAARVKKDK